MLPLGKEFPIFNDTINRDDILSLFGIKEPFNFSVTLSAKNRRDFARIMGTLFGHPEFYDMESGTIKRKLLKKNREINKILRAEFEKYGVLSPGSKEVDASALEKMIYDRFQK